MSPDNECGFYCEHPDGHYYTIGITNKLLNPTTIMAYVVQLHNGIYRDGHMFSPDKTHQFPWNACTLAKNFLG